MFDGCEYIRERFGIVLVAGYYFEEVLIRVDGCRSSILKTSAVVTIIVWLKLNKQ